MSNNPLTAVAQQVCEKRYFQRDDDGKIIEDWNDLVTRVVGHVCKDEEEQFQQKVYDLLYKTEFLPNSPCLVNAGKKTKSRGLQACQPGWSRINTNDGLIRIEDIVTEENANRIPTFTGEASITNRCHNGTKNIIRIETEKGYRLFVTEDHLVYTIHEYHRLGSKNADRLKKLCMFERAENLKIGDALVLDFSEKPFPNKCVYKNDIKVDEDLARILAFTKCDGHLKYHQGGLKKYGQQVLVFEIIVDSEESLHLITNSAHMSGNIIDIDNQQGNSHLKRIRAYGEKYSYLFNFGQFDSLNCDIPDEIFRSPKKVVAEFCRAAFDCEGSISFNISSRTNKQNGHVALGMISEQFIRDLQKLLNLFGIQSSISGPVHDKRTDYKRHPMFYLSITNTVHLKRFQKQIGFISKRKNRILSDYLAITKDKNYNKFAFVIKDIVDLGEYPVYDISTSNETYLSEGIVVHNCFVSKSPEDCWSNSDGVGMIENIANFGHIARQGGGVGIDLSLIRPEGDPVFGSTHAKACGPIEHMKMLSEVMTSITQSGFRGMAMLACIRVDHPDVLKFITCKRRDRALKSLLKEDIFDHYNGLKDNHHEHLDIVLDKFLSNFNISVSVTDEFMNKVENDEKYDLVFNGKIYQTIEARKVFDTIVENAWNNGDPGLLFYDAINRGTYQWSNQTITATNPCFHGDSMVAVADGRGFVSIKQLASEKNDVPVYCCDPETGDIQIKWGRNPRQTRSNAPLCKVTFDDGGQITTTPDHKVLLRNGEYVEVQNLTSGSSVRVMTKFQYISHRSLYNGIVKGDGQSTKPEHRMIYEFYNNEFVDKESIVHHKDFNGINNKISNLQKMSCSDHVSYHRQFNNPMTHWYPNATPEEKQRYHDNMSAATTGEKNGMHGKQHTKNTKQKIGTKASERFKNDDYRKNISTKVRCSWNDVEKRHEHSDNAKKRWQEGKYDSLKAEIVTKNCEWCGKEFSRKSFLAEQLRFCSVECGNQIDVSDNEIIDNAICFVEEYGVYPSVSTWETFENSVCSRELIRKRFINFQKLSEKLIEIGIFAKVSPNTNMTSKIIAAAIVEWTIRKGKEPSKKETIRDICSKQSLLRNGGYSKIIEEANELCSVNNVNHKVVSVEMLDKTEDVFNITVDDFHNLCVFSNEKRKSSKQYKKGKEDVSRYYAIVYKNCGEIPIPEYGSCNLGSIDISKFYNESREVIEWTRLKETIEICMQFLDNVIDANVFPTPDFKKWAKDNRPVGLGIMGWADLLLKMKIVYGSEDSLKLAHKVGIFFEKTAHKKSVELGKERGTPRSCRYKELEHRRNVVTLSIAPTGTISLLAGCSSSIEPIFSAVIYRYDNTGAKEIRHSYAKKPWFRCASDLNWKEHIDMQAAFQDHIDNSISKTINLSNDATRKDVMNAYMSAWKTNCKGITVYRDGCKSSQVLNTSTKPAVGTNQAKQRPKEVEADIFKTIADGIEWHVIVGKVGGVPHEVFAVNGKQELPDSAKVVKRKKRHYSLVTEEGEVLIDNLADEEDEIHPRIGLETRRFSLELRHNIDPKHIVAQIDKSNDVITSFSKAVGRIMKNKYISADDLRESDMPCPDCAKNGKDIQMVPEAGCWKCPSCYDSRCG